MPLVRASAKGPANTVSDFGAVTATLEISMATAGAATERNPRISTPAEALGEPEKAEAIWACN